MFSLQVFSVVDELFGTTRCLTPVGDLDIATVANLERDFTAVMESDAQTIVIDLSELSFIDSSGLHLLMRLHDACVDRPLRITSAPPQFTRLLEITGMSDCLPIVPDGDDLPSPNARPGSETPGDADCRRDADRRRPARGRLHHRNARRPGSGTRP